MIGRYSQHLVKVSVQKKTNMFTFSGFKRVRFLETMLPEQLKILSEGELLAHTLRYFCASLAMVGSITM